MSPLRTLGFCYLASASAFAVAATLSAHPDVSRILQGQASGVVFSLKERVVAPALAYARQQDQLFLDTLSNPPPPKQPIQSHAMIARAVPPQPRADNTPHAELALAPLGDSRAQPRVLDAPQFVASAQELILPDLSPLPQPALPDVAAPQAPEAHAPSVTIAEASDDVRPMLLKHMPPHMTPAPHAAPQGAARVAEARLRERLTPQMLRHFGLFLYVSKAEKGPVSQHMYVFRNQGGALTLAYDWLASTGREKAEVTPTGRHAFTDTPRGYYQLDPGRMYARYHSTSWDQAMPYAMFFNWERQGLQTGLAIHAASGDDVARLGHRASAGCVHLSPENAATLFNLIRADYRGEVPRFAYDARSQTMSRDGRFMHDREGGLKMAKGYKVLIFIEDYAGSGDTVAALF